MAPRQGIIPTPYQELNAVLEALVDRIQEILRANFVGAYLQGSFATGGFDLHSDVDFVVVSAEELSTNQVSALQGMHALIYRLTSPWAQHLEGSYFPEAVLRDHARRGSRLWYLEHGASALIESDHCNTIVARWVVREHGVILAGPPPKTLVDPIPIELLRKEIMEVIAGWGQEILAAPERFNNHFYQTFIVLSYCRMLHDLHTGYPGSKLAGAEWAKANLDPSWAGLINRTWAGRPDPARSIRRPTDPQDFADTLKFIEYVIEASNRYGTKGT